MLIDNKHKYIYIYMFVCGCGLDRLNKSSFLKLTNENYFNIYVIRYTVDAYFQENRHIILP